MIAPTTRAATGGTVLLFTTALAGAALARGGTLPWTNAPWLAGTIAGLADSVMLLGALGIATLLALAVWLVSRRRDRDPEVTQHVATPQVLSPITRMILPVLAALAILLPIAITWLLDRLDFEPESTTSTAPVGSAAASSAPAVPLHPGTVGPSTAPADPGWWLFLVVVAAGIAVLVIAAMIRRSHRGTDVRVRTAAPRPRATANEQLAQDNQIAPNQIPIETRAAVLACYAAMEAELGRAGLGRRPAETPAELARKIAGASAQFSGMSDAPSFADAGRRLATLYDEARFSDHPLPDSRRDEALTALAEVRSAVRSPA